MINQLCQEDYVYVTNFFKIIILIISLQTMLLATQVSWKKVHGIKNSIHTAHPYVEIQKGISKEISRYLRMREPINISTFIPPKIVKKSYPKRINEPSLPRDITLHKEEFETTNMFNERVKKVQEKSQKAYEDRLKNYQRRLDTRQEKIKQIDEAYINQINNRDTIIEEAKEIVENDIAYLNKKYDDKFNTLSTKLNTFSNKYFYQYFGNPTLRYIQYDADERKMQLSVHSSTSNYNQVIEIDIKPSLAKEIHNHMELVGLDVLFDINLNQKENTISLVYDKTILTINDDTYLAKSSVDTMIQVPLVAKLSVTTPTTIAKDFTPYRQKISQATFVQAKREAIEVQKYTISTLDNDLLLSKLSSKKTAKANTKKWLVVIGIQEYEMTDDIVYASNSAKAFYKVMKKMYGVVDENSYLLLNKNASSGRISDLFKELKHHVKEGDTLYFYYNGHGVANPHEDNSAYILPSDRRVEYIIADKLFALKNIYTNLLDTKASNIFVFADTCFSGSTDNQSIYKGVASARIIAKNESINNSRLSVITAGRATQFSNKYDKKAHRLMSYFLLDAILENSSTIFDIYNSMYKGVYKNSRKKGPIYTQEPQFSGNKKASL